MSYHLSNADNIEPGLFNLTNGQFYAQSIEKSLVGVGRGRKAPASSQPIPSHSTKKKTAVQGQLAFYKTKACN